MLHPIDAATRAAESRLSAFFHEHPRAALAFSGGADSAYLLHAARRFGCDVRAYCAHTAFQPAFELADAQRLARELGAQMTVVPLDILALDTVRANPADRCYHCKRAMFGQMLRAAKADGYDLMIDGTNASDDAPDRPGAVRVELGTGDPPGWSVLYVYQTEDGCCLEQPYEGIWQGDDALWTLVAADAPPAFTAMAEFPKGGNCR